MLGSSPAGIIWVGRTAASAADCKSVDFGHRQFESGPAHLCLRVREVEGASPLRRCAVTRTGGSNPPANALVSFIKEYAKEKGFHKNIQKIHGDYAIIACNEVKNQVIVDEKIGIVI